jgi:hypothetical protein
MPLHRESEESEQKQFERANLFRYGPPQPWKSFVPAKKVESRHEREATVAAGVDESPLLSPPRWMVHERKLGEHNFLIAQVERELRKVPAERADCTLPYWMPNDVCVKDEQLSKDENKPPMQLKPGLSHKEAKWYESLKWLFIIIATYLDGPDAYRVLLDIQISIKNWIRRDRRADDVAFGETFFMAYQKGFQRGKAAAAIMLAAQVPRGESKDLLSLTLPRRRTAAATWLAEPIILAENVLVALFIILVTTLAWYGLYRIALDMYNSAVGWFRRDRKAAELVMIEAPKELRTVGVQAQCHYSWYDADPRFRAHQNGFRRSGEVTVADE